MRRILNTSQPASTHVVSEKNCFFRLENPPRSFSHTRPAKCFSTGKFFFPSDDVSESVCSIRYFRFLNDSLRSDEGFVALVSPLFYSFQIKRYFQRRRNSSILNSFGQLLPNKNSLMRKLKNTLVLGQWNSFWNCI